MCNCAFLFQELNEALEASSDNTEWLCQRAYAHILLKNYSRESP